MRKLFVVVGLAACSFGLTSAAQATSSAFDAEVSANVGFVSEYAFRGLQQSDEGPALQGGFDVSFGSGVYAGIWGSNVDFNDSDEAHLETDIYAGFANSIGNFNYDVGAIYYAYPGANDSLDYDFTEVSLALGYDFEKFALSASVNYSPNFFADSGHAEYYALGLDVPLPHDFSLSGHVGRQEIEDNTAYGVDDYTDWSVGLGYNVQGFDLSLQYVDTDLDEDGVDCNDGCEERVIFGVSRSF